MDLHNLHRQTPSAAQQASPQPRAPSHTPVEAPLLANRKPEPEMQQPVHPHDTQDLSKALEKARAHAAHWQRETEKMDRIARDAMEKLAAKRAAKTALKAQYLAACKDAEVWQTRYNELSAARTAATRDSLHSNDRTLQQQAAELARARETIQQQAAELVKLRATVQNHEAEVPGIRERLEIGGAAFRKLKLVEPKLQDAEQRALDAETKLTASQRQRKTIEQDLLTLKSSSTRQAELDAARIRQTTSDLAVAKEKLSAATQEISARTAETQASTDMLSRTEQVLETCSQLFASKEPDHPLAQALLETKCAVNQFLARTRAGMASRG